MRFEFATATRILFGRGCGARSCRSRAKADGRASRCWSRAFAGNAPSGSLEAVAMPSESTAPLLAVHVRTLPSTSGSPGRGACPPRVVRLGDRLGGGSAIDAGKAIAALLTNRGELDDYLEVIGKGQPLHCPSLPFIAVPMTAGTGSEVTRNAVLASAEHRVKVSLRSPLMLARLAVVDPELTLDCRPHVTARTGLDALTQLIEPYVSHAAPIP